MDANVKILCVDDEKIVLNSLQSKQIKEKIDHLQVKLNKKIRTLVQKILI